MSPKVFPLANLCPERARPKADEEQGRAEQPKLYSQTIEPFLLWSPREDHREKGPEDIFLFFWAEPTRCWRHGFHRAHRAEIHRAQILQMIPGTQEQSIEATEVALSTTESITPFISTNVKPFAHLRN